MAGLPIGEPARTSGRILLAYLGLGVVLAALGVAGAPPGLFLPALLAPVLGCAYAVRGEQLPIPKREPCSRSGSVAGWHWFEFPSQPAHRRWLWDDATAKAIRDRAPKAPDASDQRLHIRSTSDRTRRHVWAAWVNLVSILLAVLLVLALPVALSLLGSAETTLSDVAKTSACVLAYTTLLGIPIVLLQWLPTTVGLRLWQGIGAARTTHSIELSGTVLWADGRSFYLTEDVVSELHHDPFGAVLDLSAANDAITLRGDHAPLHWLHEHVASKRARTGTREPSETARKLLRAVSQRAPTPTDR